MSDVLQVAVVTAAAAFAAVGIVRPYFQRPTTGRSAPCPKCTSSTPCVEPAPEPALIQIGRRSDLDL